MKLKLEHPYYLSTWAKLSTIAVSQYYYPLGQNNEPNTNKPSFFSFNDVKQLVAPCFNNINNS